MSDLTYSKYIRVAELLDLQEPLSCPDPSLTRVCEHFFIVTHQTSELWLAQVLLDLDEAAASLSHGRYLDADECLQRSAVVMETMAVNLDALATMPPGRFACFRGNLGRASGAQSTQFAQLDHSLGLSRNGECPVFDALVASCEKEGATLPGLLRPGEPDHAELARVVLSMLDVSRKTWKWKVMHLELVAKMLGHQQSGTGGTSGAKYLAGRLAMPFEALWAAVSEIHQA